MSIWIINWNLEEKKWDSSLTPKNEIIKVLEKKT